MGANPSSEHEGEDHECDPTEDGLLPVLGAPATSTLCEIALGTHDASMGRVGLHADSLFAAPVPYIGGPP